MFPLFFAMSRGNFWKHCIFENYFSLWMMMDLGTASYFTVQLVRLFIQFSFILFWVMCKSNIFNHKPNKDGYLKIFKIPLNFLCCLLKIISYWHNDIRKIIIPGKTFFFVYQGRGYMNTLRVGKDLRRLCLSSFIQLNYVFTKIFL